MNAHVVTGWLADGPTFVARGAFRDEHAREGAGGPKCVEVDRMSAGSSGRSRSAADIERARALCSA
jgi:hypothetical protein